MRWNSVKGLLMAIFALMLVMTGRAHAQNTSLSISGIRSEAGNVLVSVFRDEQGFRDNKPVSRLKFTKAQVKNGMLKVSLNLMPGSYGIALLDDENGNGKMDNNMIGMPKEGFGFSNFYLNGLSRPSFADFDFEVGTAPLALTAKFRYL